MADPVDPLTLLKDIHLPPDPAFWPPAVGWWLIAFLIPGIIWFTVRTIINRLDAGRPAREFIHHLNQVTIDERDSMDHALYEISRLVKQFAIHRYGRQRTASLAGKEWLEFLDSTTKNGDGFSTTAGKALGSQMYHRNIDTNPAELKDLLIEWAKGKK